MSRLRLRLRTFVACDKTVVSTWGDIDLSTSPLLGACLTALAAPDCRLILNLSHTFYMDGTALTVLENAHKVLCAGGGELRLVGCRPAVLRILRLSGLDRLFSVEERRGRAALVSAPPAAA